MKTDLIISCPCCGKEATVTMEIVKSGVDSLISAIIPDIKQYTFNGHKKCVCGNVVMVTLTVTGGATNDKH